MTRETRVTVHDLPVETLDMILDELDDFSFMAFTRVNHSFGQTALWRKLPETALDHINAHPEFTIGPDTPASLLSVIAISLWTPKITAITYSVERDEEGHFFDDMRSLSFIISRLTHGSLKSLKVRFALDYTGPMRRGGLQGIDKCDWPEVLGQLLDVVTSVGCNQVEFSIGQIPLQESEGYRFNFLDMPSAFSRFRDDMKSMFRQFNYRPPPPTTLGVRALIFETPLFFTDGFLSHTARVLQQTSCTIQSLTISFPGSHQWVRSRSYMWSSLCLSVRLPHLSSLVLKSSGSTVDITCDALLNLLSHLPNLTSLTLDFISRFPLIPLRKRYPILPKLESLEAQPQFLPWLIPFTRHAWKSGLFLPIAGGMIWRPSLMSIHILTGREGVTMNDLNDSILSLNALFPLDNGSGGLLTPDISITIKMNFAESFWAQWIVAGAHRYRPAAGSQARDCPEPPARSQIVHLTLAVVGESAGPQSSLLDDDFARIIDWMGMFPKLEHLEILGEPFIQSVANEALCVAIVEEYNQLKSFKFNGNLFKSDYSHLTSPVI